MDKNLDIAIRFAKDNSGDFNVTAIKRKEKFNGKDVYVIHYTDDPAPCVGMPEFFFVENGHPFFASLIENRSLIGLRTIQISAPGEQLV